jgi:hypothetical protein
MGRILPRPSCTGLAWVACTAHVAHYCSGAAARAHGRLAAQRARRPECIARALARARRRDSAASWGKAARVWPMALEEMVAWCGCAALSRGGVARRREREHVGGLTGARKGDAGELVGCRR